MTGIRLTASHWIVYWLLAAAVAGCEWSGNEASGILIIESKPASGADVRVDGVSFGKTPARVSGLPGGKAVLVHLTHDGFKPKWRNVTVPDHGEQHVEFDLEPRVGFLSVESEPPGAHVFLDGATDLGPTPLVERPVPVGEHAYELRLDNYKTLQNSVKVEEDYPYKFVHRLSPRAAQIRVASHPLNASVWLNDQLQERTTPATFDVVPGTYTVAVHTKGYVLTEGKVTVGPNEEKTITLDMKEGEAPLGMVLVPSGEFTMGFDQGSPDEKPQRKVKVDAFYIDKFEVTNREYQAVVPAFSFPKGKEHLPVTGVTWDEANAFAQAVGKRLPKETEWEKAARGADARQYPWGDTFDAAKCNSADKSNLGLEEIGKYRPGASPYGCMDMAGNAYEWTDSYYSAYEGNTEIQKDYGLVFKVLRGGSYLTDQFGVRCAKRSYDRMQSTREDYGFRCAKDAAAAPGRGKPAN